MRFAKNNQLSNPHLNEKDIDDDDVDFGLDEFEM